ncbi:MAG: trigger factor [Candidatus Omnitrophica bacterium]|nr:trigger factor [Candidatus Omnitrophota bacterium]
MKTEVKNLENGKKEIAISLSGETIKNKFEEVFKKIGESAKVPGFRPGHVPRDMLEKNFSGQAHDQVLKELIPDIYDKAIEKEGLDVVDLPEITEVKLDRVNISFKATVDVRPEIPIKDYKGIKVHFKNIEVSPDDVKRSIDSLKESRKLDAADDDLAKCLGYPSLAELENVVQRQLFLEKSNAERQKIDNEIIEAVLKDLHFKVPKAIVDRQLEDMVRQAKVDLALKGVPRESIDKETKSISEKLLPNAERQVRVFLVLAEIAKKENIARDEHMPRKVMELLLKEASWQQA